jgi:hypothetical protein
MNFWRNIQRRERLFLGGRGYARVVPHLQIRDRSSVQALR